MLYILPLGHGKVEDLLYGRGVAVSREKSGTDGRYSFRCWFLKSGSVGSRARDRAGIDGTSRRCL